MQAVLDFANEVNVAAREGQRADQWMLERVAGLLSAEIVAYSQFDASQRLCQDAEYPGPAWEPTEPEWELLRTQNPFTEYGARIGNPHFFARRLTDIVDRRTFRRTALYELTGGAASVSIQMRMPGESGTTWVFEVVRNGRNYSRRDLLLLDSLRPWLIAYEDQRVLHEKVAVIQATPSHRTTDVGLSARENEVLDLVAEGATNAAIAARLWISRGTVRKHLDNVYIKLEVGSRTAALARTGRAVAAPPSSTRA